uniref:CUB domain-containing protein n=1 Tax=Steinernema glaseri TaxID=37863 RepID=A0A1I8AT40_9BILA
MAVLLFWEFQDVPLSLLDGWRHPCRRELVLNAMRCQNSAAEGQTIFGARFFAINQRDTVMHARNPDYQLSLGAAIGPMYGDVYEMNMLYSCYDRCKDSGTVCKNEGMPNPNNCKVCQCPSGFEGNDCSQRQASSHGLKCGETLDAGADWQILESNGVVGAGNYDSRQGNRSDPYRCTWHITAPEGKVIEYDVTFIGTKNQRNDMLCYPVCYFGGLKIKGHEKTWKPEGMKLCCAKQLNKIR